MGYLDYRNILLWSQSTSCSHHIILDLWSKEGVHAVFSKVMKNTDMEAVSTYLFYLMIYHFKILNTFPKTKLINFKKSIILSSPYINSFPYGWFMLRFDRKQQNSIKQLSFKNIIKKKKTFSTWLIPQKISHMLSKYPTKVFWKVLVWKQHCKNLLTVSLFDLQHSFQDI